MRLPKGSDPSLPLNLCSTFSRGAGDAPDARRAAVKIAEAVVSPILNLLHFIGWDYSPGQGAATFVNQEKRN
jgi:hypothetical protein